MKTPVFITKKMIKNFLMGSTLFAVIGCNYNINKAGTNSVLPNGVFSEKTTSYARVNEVIIQKYCNGCHTGGGEADGVRLDSYADLMANLPEVRASIAAGRMPKRRSAQRAAWDLQSEQLKAYFERWVVAGAQEQETSLPEETPPDESTTTTTTSTTLPPVTTTTTMEPTTPATLPPVVTTTTTISPDGVAVRYNDVATALVQPYCLRCHGSEKPRGDIVLEGYENLKKNALVSKEAIDMGIMPPRGVQIPAEVLTKLDQWISAGMPQ